MSDTADEALPSGEKVISDAKSQEMQLWWPQMPGSSQFRESLVGVP